MIDAPLVIISPQLFSTEFLGGRNAQRCWLRQEKTHEAQKVQERQEVMSLAIEVDDVVKVNISGKWYDVNHYDDGRTSSFALDSYEFLNGSLLLHGGGEGGMCATGFTFVDAETNLTMAGPLTSITAVMTADSEVYVPRVTPLKKQKVN